MKKKGNSIQRIMSLILAALLFASMPVEVMAETYQISNAEQMTSSWNDANSGSDTSNTFNLTQDVDMSGEDALEAKEDRTYIIQSSKNKEIVNVEITGPVISDVDSNPVVIINTDITGESDTALDIDGGVSVTVNGDISADSNAIVGGNGVDITVKGDVSGDVFLHSGSNGHITGDLTAAEDQGVNLISSNLTVDGDVKLKGDNFIAAQSNLIVNGDLTSSPVSDPAMDNTLSVDGYVYVGGKTDVENLWIMDDSAMDTGALDAKSIVVGLDAETGDTSELNVAGNITYGKGETELTARSESYVQVIGNVTGTVTAQDNALVEIYGTASKTNYAGNGRVVTNVGKEPDQHYKETTGTADDALVKLCREYGQTSNMGKHISCLLQLVSRVSTDLTDKMGLGSAVMTSLSQHEKINLDALPTIALLVDYDDDSFNKGSVMNYENAKYLNSFYINTYKDALHEVINSNTLNLEDFTPEREEVEKIADICKAFLDLNESGQTLTASQMKDIKAMFDTKNMASLKECKDFLIKYKFFASGETGINAATKRLRDMLNFAHELKQKPAVKVIEENAQGAADVAEKTISAVEYVFTAADFVDYWMDDYEAPMRVLDVMLEEQTMSAEMFVAVASLRQEYSDKYFGTADRMLGELAKFGTHEIKKLFPLYNAVDGGVSAVCTITGISKDSEKKLEAAALCGLVPQLLTSYENAIKKVQSGDTSDEAINLVKMTYAMTVEGLTTMCENMVEIGNILEKDGYESVLWLLKNSMKIGKTVPVPQKAFS